MNTTTSWTPIPQFENHYCINANQEVKAVKRHILDSIGRLITIKERTMTQFPDRGGYWTVKLTKGNKYGTKYIHRLMAMAFIPNPFNKPIVNHINGDKRDNRIENLEWVTSSENQKHAIKMNLCKAPHENSKPVLDRCTGKSYPSMKAVSIDQCIPYENVKQMLKRKMSTCLEFAA